MPTAKEIFSAQERKRAKQLTISNIKGMVEKIAPHCGGNQELVLTFQRILDNEHINPVFKAVVLNALPSCYAYHLLRNETCLKRIKELFATTTKIKYLQNRAAAYSANPSRYRPLELDMEQLADIVDVAAKYKKDPINYSLSVTEAQDAKVDDFKLELKAAALKAQGA